jgi:hypothetical protein
MMTTVNLADVLEYYRVTDSCGLVWMESEVQNTVQELFFVSVILVAKVLIIY